MEKNKRPLKMLSCILSLMIACSCGIAPEESTESPNPIKTENLPSYSENTETSVETSELSEEPTFEFSEAQKIIEDFFLGVWENESNERFMIGIAEESDCKDFFDRYGLLWEAHLTDTSAVIVCRNFISERYQIVIDFCDPDILLFYDHYEEKADSDCQKYTRVGRASMYPDTGIMNSYLMSMLYHCYGYIELSTDIESLSTASVYFNGKNAGKELTVLISHDNNQIVLASSFMPLANQNEEDGITYIQYTKIKNEGEWCLEDWSYVDYKTIKKMIQEIEPDPIKTQDDFSDIIELMKQSSEGFDQIAERAFHTEIKNDMEMEEIISLLMDRYIICTNTYDVRTLFDWDFDEQFEYLDHTYYKMQHRYFNTLAEMEDFVRGTFTHEWAEIWISTSSSTDSSNTYVPRFIQKEDGIYFCIPDYVFIPPPSFLDNHIIEIKECSEMECVFSYNANIDLKRYKQMCEVTGEISWPESAFLHEGKIVLEDGEWKIDSIFPAAF